jgi:hypothetical protein
MFGLPCRAVVSHRRRSSAYAMRGRRGGEDNHVKRT